MGWQVIISTSARRDLESIVRFIAQHNADAAARTGYQLITQTGQLTRFPRIGRIVPEFRRNDLREIIWRSYRIIYRLSEKESRIEVVRFWHGARGFPNVTERG